MRLGLAVVLGSLGVAGAVAACVGDTSSNGADAGQDATSSADGGGTGADTSTPMVDAGAGTDSSAIDASTDAWKPLCDLTKSFNTPQPLANIDTTESEDVIWLTPDQLTGYVSARRTDGGIDGGGGYDLFTTTRTTVTLPFGPIAPLAGSLNTPADQRSPVVSADGLTLYYYSTQTGTGQIYTATRAQTNVAFGAGQPALAPLNTTAGDTVSWISADALTVFLSSNRGGTTRIYSATRASTSVDFQAPTTSGMPSTTGVDDNMVTTADQLTAYFASTEVGGKGNFDVWMATRTSTANGFGTPVHVPELSTTNIDSPTWLSPEGCTIYVLQEQPGMSGVYDLFVASKPAL
jgi:hypothetical protein